MFSITENMRGGGRVLVFYLGKVKLYYAQGIQERINLIIFNLFKNEGEGEIFVLAKHF